ncbi:hypothetical protein KGF54_000532 [Candida jiufengensis]|uniref:uncharacterized protein n=1 Tax=Candida jiufengensis TaxID=497108 RepID=UPI002225321F|nr:uncharacterized protein KGF54_000532 [Candida jiufengensis]KAI5956913.1 hypothetical protein KGF54_000532 [Candida jiufengensis]
MQYHPKAEGKQADIPLPSPGNNAFMRDIFTSDAPEGKKITAGFYRQEAGEELEFVYEFDEMKIIIEVEGELTLTDETGLVVSAKPGDVFYFPKGSKVVFKSTGYGLGFFTGLRDAL